MPSCDQTGTPSGFEGFLHFCSSTAPGSACLINWRIWESVAPRQSSSWEGSSPFSESLFFMSLDRPSLLFGLLGEATVGMTRLSDIAGYRAAPLATWVAHKCLGCGEGDNRPPGTHGCQAHAATVKLNGSSKRR